jgi:hypothetical protein
MKEMARERAASLLSYFSLSQIFGWLIHSPQTDKVCFHFFWDNVR